MYSCVFVSGVIINYLKLYLQAFFFVVVFRQVKKVMKKATDMVAMSLVQLRRLLAVLVRIAHTKKKKQMNINQNKWLSKNVKRRRKSRLRYFQIKKGNQINRKLMRKIVSTKKTKWIEATRSRRDRCYEMRNVRNQKSQEELVGNIVMDDTRRTGVMSDMIQKNIETETEEVKETTEITEREEITEIEITETIKMSSIKENRKQVVYVNQVEILEAEVVLDGMMLLLTSQGTLMIGMAKENLVVGAMERAEILWNWQDQRMDHSRAKKKPQITKVRQL